MNLLLKWRAEIANGQVRVMFLDECHLLWGDISGYGWSRRNQRVDVEVKSTRERQTYYGALDYLTKHFVVHEYSAGNEDNTIAFLKYLQSLSDDSTRLVIIWDGASYHRSEQMQQYLEQVNAGKIESDWQLYCLRFAPNAPQQNPVEDIWLQAKTYVRQHYYQCPSFKSLKQLFMQFLDGRVFDFPKLHSYG